MAVTQLRSVLEPRKVSPALGLDGLGVVGAVGGGVGLDGLGVIGAVLLAALLDLALALAAQVADLALVASLVGFSRLEDCTQLAQDVPHHVVQLLVGEMG